MQPDESWSRLLLCLKWPRLMPARTDEEERSSQQDQDAGVLDLSEEIIPHYQDVRKTKESRHGRNGIEPHPERTHEVRFSHPQD